MARLLLNMVGPATEVTHSTAAPDLRQPLHNRMADLQGIRGAGYLASAAFNTDSMIC